MRQVLYSNKTHGTLMSDVDRAAHEFVCLGDLGEDVGEGDPCTSSRSF